MVGGFARLGGERRPGRGPLHGDRPGRGLDGGARMGACIRAPRGRAPASPAGGLLLVRGLPAAPCVGAGARAPPRLEAAGGRAGPAGGGRELRRGGGALRASGLGSGSLGVAGRGAVALGGRRLLHFPHGGVFTVRGRWGGTFPCSHAADQLDTVGDTGRIKDPDPIIRAVASCALAPRGPLSYHSRNHRFRWIGTTLRGADGSPDRERSGDSPGAVGGDFALGT